MISGSFVCVTRFRTDSLNREPTPQEWAVYLQRRKRGDYGPTKSRFSAIIVVALVVAVFGSVFVLVVLPLLRSVLGGVGTGSGAVFPFVWTGLGVLAVVQGTRAAVKSVRKRKRWASLAQFAEDNQLQFRIRSADPAYPGCLFSLGHSRGSEHHVWADQGLLADCGSYTWMTGSGKNKSTHTWNFAAFRLPQAMPHILLDAAANNVVGMSNLPATFHADQRLTLGAPFDDQYALYAPQGYGQDAFYLFPPDLLAMLIDAPADFDIEIIDRWMFFYTQSVLDLTDDATWGLLGGIEDTIGERLAQMSDRYVDRRVHTVALGQSLYGPGQPARLIDQSGRRLRKGFNPIVLVFVAGWVAYLVISSLV